MKDIQLQKYDIRDFIQVVRLPAESSQGAHASPFNLRFKAKRLSKDLQSVIAGPCIYLGVSNGLVVYLGKYQPAHGKIINDRLGRHLQTLTARGADIGFGGNGNPNRRLQYLLDAVSNERLRDALLSECEASTRRFRDTGYNTSPNRLRFASENWDRFGTDDESILDRLSFTLVRMNPNSDQRTCEQQISTVEKCLLGEFRPFCNAQYRTDRDAQLRSSLTVERVIKAVSDHMLAVTGHDARDCITLGA